MPPLPARAPLTLFVPPQVQFNPQGNRIITGRCLHPNPNPQPSPITTASSDKTCRMWSVETGECLQILEGHIDEIFSCAFNYEGDTVITGSKDNTCRIWKC